MLYAVFFNSTLHTIPPEYFPVHLRGYGLAVGDFAQGVTNIWLNQVSPAAFGAIHWKYYSVFIACLISLAVFYFFYLQETNQVPLEAIAAQFGDETVDAAKASAIHAEDTMEDTERAGFQMVQK
jgi:hypothetical protein